MVIVVLETKAKWAGSGIRGRARLLTERIEFRSIGITGRKVHSVELAEIVSAEWWTSVSGGPNVRFQMNNGESHAVWLENPGIWRAELASRIGDSIGEARLPTHRKSVRSAA
jgi:hypothetical protein